MLPRSLAVLALLLASSALARPADDVLWDARRQDAYPAGVTAYPKLPPAELKAVLSRVATRFATERKQCADDLALFEVSAVARGAFTAKGARETAYIVRGWPCDPELDRMPEGPHLVILDGKRTTAHAQGPSMLEEPRAEDDFFGTDIRALPDLDGDGVLEILATGSAFGQGVLQQTAWLYSAKGGHVRTLQEFQEVYLDDCNTLREDRQAQAKALRVGKGGAISADDWVAPCREDNADPKPEDFRRAEPPAAEPAPK
jgi:hypothetical protein